MKLLGGEWSKGDLFALLTALAAILTIPGMPRILHLDSASPSKVVPLKSDLSPSPHNPSEKDDEKSNGTNPVAGGAEITSVSPIGPKAWQKIVIKGAHFGMGQPFNTSTDFLRITDLTDNRVFGPNAPLFVSAWTDTEIVIEGFPQFKQGQDAFNIGDVIKIGVANFTQVGWVSSGDNFRGAPVAWYSTRITR